MCLSVITIVLFGELLLRYFEYGLEDSVKMHLLAEWQSYQEELKSNPQAPLPNTYIISFQYDEPADVIIDGQNVLAGMVLAEDEFQTVSIDETVTDDINQEAMVGIYCFRHQNGRSVYGSIRYDLERLSHKVDMWFDGRLNLIVYISGIYILCIYAALWYYSYGVGKKTKLLASWSEEVSANVVSSPAPDFKFAEYNKIALCLENALKKNAKLIEREQHFLAHASHELRTPIAIIRANMEILERMALPSDSHGPIGRIDRASSSMQQITETMLWLVRKSETPPNQCQVSLVAMIDNIIDELQYLIQGEDVTVITNYSHAPTLQLPETPIEIVVGNLIRNAFQYTHSGKITINYELGCIIIKNVNTQELDTQFKDSFGLGHDLTEKICNKLDWELETMEIKDGFIAKLHLPK